MKFQGIEIYPKSSHLLVSFIWYSIVNCDICKKFRGYLLFVTNGLKCLFIQIEVKDFQNIICLRTIHLHVKRMLLLFRYKVYPIWNNFLQKNELVFTFCYGKTMGQNSMFFPELLSQDVDEIAGVHFVYNHAGQWLYFVFNKTREHKLYSCGLTRAFSHFSLQH